jgi:hypothetical protein
VDSTVCNDVPLGYRLTSNDTSPFAEYEQTVVPGLPPGCEVGVAYVTLAGVLRVAAGAHVSAVDVAVVVLVVVDAIVVDVDVVVVVDDDEFDDDPHAESASAAIATTATALARETILQLCWCIDFASHLDGGPDVAHDR